MSWRWSSGSLKNDPGREEQYLLGVHHIIHGTEGSWCKWNANLESKGGLWKLSRDVTK